MLTRPEQARSFLEAYFGPIPPGSILEVRGLKLGKGVVRREWFTRVADIDVTKFPDDEDLYFGVCLRREGTTTATKDDLTSAVALWADIDNVSNKDHMANELRRLHAPTWIIDSGNGLHVYWALNKPFDISTPAKRDLLERIAAGMASQVKAPPGTHDSTRILRIPGTYNNKGGMQKLVTVLYADLTRQHDILDLRKRYEVAGAVTASPAMLPAVTASPTMLPAPLPPATSALIVDPDKLAVDAETRALIVNGAPQGERSEADAKVVKALVAAGYTYEHVEAIYQVNPIGEKFREAGNGARYLRRTHAKVATWIDLTPRIREHNGTIEARHGKEWNTVLAHPMKCTKWLEGDEHALEVEIYRPDGTYTRRIKGEDFASKVSFKRALDMAAGWTGTDDDVQRLQEYLQLQNPPRRTAKRVLGWHQEEVVFPNATLTRAGFHAGKYEYIGALADARLEDMDPQEWEALSTQALQMFAAMHDNGITIPALGWMLASFAAPFVRKVSRQDAFPHLLLFGAAGTGKTTIMEQIQAITGYGAGRIEPAPSITAFALIHSLSTSNTVPVLLDEYRRNRAMEKLHSTLRAAYHAQLPKRGQANLNVVTFRLQAPVVIAGESSFRDDALARRTLSLHIENDKHDPALVALNDLPLTRLNGGFYKLVMATDLPAVWAQAVKRIDAKQFSADTDARTTHNWTTAAFGLLLAADLLGAAEVDKMIARFPEWRGAATQDLVSPEKQTIYGALVAIKEMIRANRIRANTEYMLRIDPATGESFLWFFSAQLPHIVEDYFARNPSENPVTLESVVSLLRSESARPNSIIGAYQQPFSYNNKTHRGTALNLAEIERQYEIPQEQWTYMQVAGSDRL